MGVARYIRDKKDRINDVILQSGIHVKPLYTEEDLKEVGFDYNKDLGNPGEYPYTRGIHPLGYRSRQWTTRQYSGFGTPKETNERWKLLISQGQTGLNVAFDLPTQMGYDSDDPMAEGEVGRVGMAIDSLKDFEIAFKDIDMATIGAGLTINAIASIMVAMYQATAEKYGFSKQQVSCTPQNDILKEIVGRGAWIFPVEPAVRLIGDVIEYSVREVPRNNPVSVCGYHIREAGATPVQEIAYAIGIANAYIDEVLKRGLHIDDFVARFSFNLDVFGNLWEQVAKFRAARKLWAKNIREKYGAKNEKSMFLRGIFGGGGGGLTKEQPENNIVRSAYYALVAALSSGQTTALCSYDEAYTIPTPHSALISLRTLQLLMEEVGLRDTVDPLAGSYFIETLTKQIEEKIVEEIHKIDRLGGMVKAISSGYIQKEVARQAYEFEKGVQTGEIIKVGVNKYVGGEQGEVELHEYSDESANEQMKSLQEVRRIRDNRDVTRTLKELEKATKEKKNVMPYLVNCCKAYATVGEMTNVFRDIFGEFAEPNIF
jgi:methylmalonyl-CoA mutase N-terminal domain/subunit